MGLFKPKANHFLWQIDNFLNSYTDGGMGVAVSGGELPHEKGSPVQILAGSSVVQDVYAIMLIFSNGYSATQIKRYLVDLLIDPAGGSNWTIAISNLLVNSPSMINGGWRYYFPLYFKAGTSFAMRHQCSQGLYVIMRCGIRLFGQPTCPEDVKCGSYVESFGVETSTTSGTNITPGNQVMGNWTLMGTSSKDLWWWQWGGQAVNDTSIGPIKSVLGQVGAGDGTNMVLCCESYEQLDVTENCGKCAGIYPPIAHIKGGTNIYVREASSGTPDIGPSTTCYGLGG